MKNLSSPIELIKKSFAVFFEQKNLFYFMKIYLPLVPFAIISGLQQNFLKANFQILSWVTGASILIGIVYLLVYFWVSVAGIFAVGNVLGGRILSVKDTYRNAWDILWKFSLLSTLLFLILFGGFLLLIIPGIIFGVWFTFSGYILVEKNTKITEAISQSRQLVKGNFWKVFGRLFVFGLFTGIFQGIVGLVPYGIGAAFSAALGALFILPYYLLYKELSV